METSVYCIIGLSWICPELCEGRGEIAAIQSSQLPSLAEQGNIKGDPHVHTPASDGTVSLEVMVTQACLLGYQYLVVADHSSCIAMAHGLTAERLAV